MQDGNLLTVSDTGDGFVRLQSLAGGDQAEFEGNFASCLGKLLDETAGASEKKLLELISRQTPWLNGLENASPTPPSLRSLVLGSEPGICFIELTARCNERCLHCYAESDPEREEELNIDEIRQLLDELRELGDPMIQFTGGDPLICKDLVAAVEHAHGLGFSGIEIYTNGLSLTDALLEKLLPFEPRFSFSVYSHDAATHDKITRVPGSHKRTMSAIRRAQNHGLIVRANAVIMAENRGHERHLQKYLHEEMGIPWHLIGFDTVKQMGRGDFFDYQLDIDYHAPGHTPQEEPVEEQPESPSTQAPAQRFGKLCIAGNGDVYPCIFSRSNRLGNIRQHGLLEIMAQLDRPGVNIPSAERWQQCVHSLTCYDCRIVSYALGEADLEQDG